MSEQITFEATYSPEDNKLRLYASDRLPPELYARLREVGYRWAPRQELFVAPMWTVQRKDLAMELAGEIGDEMTTAEERAEQRAERFKGYQANRLKDAENAYSESEALAGEVPMGQPIHVGHHSQRKAEKQAERIDSTMKKAVKMWDCSEYWKSRAQGVASNVKYKERQDVRLRRIKKLEASARKQERYIASCGDDLEANKAFHQQWLDHYTLRINYEKAILDAEGYVEPKKVKRKLSPIINCAGEKVVEITKEQYKRIRDDGRYCRKVGATADHGAYRQRFACRMDLERVGAIEKPDNYWSSEKIFITDQKIVEIPQDGRSEL